MLQANLFILNLLEKYVDGIYKSGFLKEMIQAAIFLFTTQNLNLFEINFHPSMKKHLTQFISLSPPRISNSIMLVEMIF